MRRVALVHLASGVGNIVFATPLLVALSELDFLVDVLLDADYPSTVELLRPWSLIRSVVDQLRTDSYTHVIPAIPPFYWARFRESYKNVPNALRRPPDRLFYANEQDYYLEFARALGYPTERKPFYRLPLIAANRANVTSATLVIAPGCKTGEMALKRWPYFPQLAERFTDVILVGTADDLQDARDRPLRFSSHVRSFVDRLSLRETAELMAGAGAVVGNDSGLCHVAGAVGTPTLVLFGPTPHITLGQFPENVRILRAGIDCEPCWFGDKFRACNHRIDCLTHLTVGVVESEARFLLGASQ